MYVFECDVINVPVDVMIMRPNFVHIVQFTVMSFLEHVSKGQIPLALSFINITQPCFAHSSRLCEGYITPLAELRNKHGGGQK